MNDKVSYLLLGQAEATNQYYKKIAVLMYVCTYVVIRRPRVQYVHHAHAQ